MFERVYLFEMVDLDFEEKWRGVTILKCKQSGGAEIVDKGWDLKIDELGS